MPQPHVASLPKTAISLKLEWRYLLMAILGPLVLYMFTMPSTVTFEDSGQFILVAKELGIAHPPGYPLWSWIAKGFACLNIGSVAYRTNLCSAVFGALSCGAVYWCCRLLMSTRPSAMLAAYAYAASATFWSLSIITEVYTLNTFFFFTLFALCLGYYKSPSTLRLLILSFMWGLGLTNHFHLLMLSSPALMVLLLAHWKHVLKYSWACLGCAALGLLPYVYMYYRSQGDVAINFFGPIDGAIGLLRYITRLDIHATDTSPSADWHDKLQYADFLGRELLHQFTPVGAIVIAGGVVMQWRRWPAAVCVSMIMAFLGSSVVLWALLTFDYELSWRTAFSAYPLIPYGIMAIWLALGIDSYMSWRFGKKGPLKRAVLRGMTVGVCCILIGSHWYENNRRDDRWAEDYGRAILDMCADDSVLVVGPDLDYGPVGYLLHATDYPKTIELFNGRGMVFSNRKYDWQTSKTEQDDIWIDYLLDSDKPFFYTGALQHPFAQADFGIVKQVFTSLSEGTALRAPPTVELLDFTRRFALAESFHDGWTQLQRNSVLGHMGRMLTRFLESPKAHELDQDIRDLLDILEKTFYGNLGQAEAFWDLGDYRRTLHAIETALEFDNDTVLKHDHAMLYEMAGMCWAALQEPEKSQEAFEQSLAAWPTLDNRAVYRLAEKYKSTQNESSLQSLQDRFADAHGYEALQSFINQLESRDTDK